MKMRETFFKLLPITTNYCKLLQITANYCKLLQIRFRFLIFSFVSHFLGDFGPKPEKEHFLAEKGSKNDQKKEKI